MLTLADVVAEIVDETERTDLEEQIAKTVQSVIRTQRKRLHWFSVRRAARITCVAGQVWYGRFDALSPERLADVSADGATRIYEDGGEPESHYPWGFDGPDAVGGEVKDLLKIDSVALIDASSATDWWWLTPIDIERFNRGRDPRDSQNRPVYYCLYSGQIGLDPIPDAAHVIRVYGTFRAPVPELHDTSVFFDEALELVRYFAKAHLYRQYLEDPEMAQQMEAAAVREQKDLRREHRLKTTTGRLTPRR